MPGNRQHLRRAIHRVAFEQAGYFTAAQAKAAGYSYQAQKYHVDHGNWQRIDRALFRLPDWPTARTDDYIRWTLWSDGRAVISHESALAFHELSDVSPSKVHVTVPPGFRAKDDHVRVHVDLLPPIDVEHHLGFAVTTVERSLLDVSGIGASQEIVDGAVADALTGGRTTTRLLRRRAADASDKAALGIERALSRLSEEA